MGKRQINCGRWKPGGTSSASRAYCCSAGGQPFKQNARADLANIIGTGISLGSDEPSCTRRHRTDVDLVAVASRDRFSQVAG